MSTAKKPQASGNGSAREARAESPSGPNDRNITSHTSRERRENCSTQQHLRDELTTSHIVDRLLSGASIDRYRATSPPKYGDFSNANDYQEALDQVAAVRSWFDAQPAQFRQQFGEDPRQVLDFVDNPEHLEDSHRLGLISDKEYARLKPADPEPAAGSGKSTDTPAAPTPTPTQTDTDPSGETNAPPGGSMPGGAREGRESS